MCHANLLIRRWLFSKRLNRRSHDVLNLKDLIADLKSQVSVERRTTVSGSVGRAKRGEGKLLIPQCLLAKSPRRTGEDLLNLKHLLAVLPPSYRAIFSGLVGPLKRGALDLLIPQGLSARLPRRTGDGVLNLKDLLAGFPPRLRRLFENEACFEASFCAESHQIPPFSAKTWRNMAEDWGFAGAQHWFSWDGSWGNCRFGD